MLLLLLTRIVVQFKEYNIVFVRNKNSIDSFWSKKKKKNNRKILTLKVLSKIVADGSLNFLNYFSEKINLAFHVNHLLGR